MLKRRGIPPHYPAMTTIPRSCFVLAVALMLARCGDTPAPVPVPVPVPPGAVVVRMERDVPFALAARPLAPAEMQLRIRPAKPLTGPPSVEISATGRQPGVLATTFDAAASAYVVTAPIAVGERLLVLIRGTARDGATLTSLASINTGALDPAERVTVFSADGHLSLTVPAGGLPAGAWLAIAPADVPPPSGVVVREPRLIASSSGDERLARPGVVRFVLPDPHEGGAVPRFDPATVRVERYDPRRGAWEPQPSTSEPVPLSGGVFLETDRLGIYAVTARRR